MPSKMLEPLDICIFVNRGQSPWDKMQRWGLGDPYTHVFLYLGTKAIEGRKVIYESVGRGVVLSPPSGYFGQEIIVLRPQITPYQRDLVIQEALNIVCDVDSFYDYVSFGKMGLSLILLKLHLHVPLRYQRDGLYICSEAVAEPFLRYRIPILPQDRCPLPGDYLKSLLCQPVHRGIWEPAWLD